MAKQVVIIGPAHPLRGGLSTFDHRLCKQFAAEGYDCSIYSFSLQYPSILFPGTSQFTTEPAPEGIEIFSVINSIYPPNWIQIGNTLKNIRPDLIVVRFWLPFMGPALGTILRRVKKNKHTRIVAITDNVIPHEKRPGDTPFTRYFLKACDGFVTMSDKVMKDLRQFEASKPARLASHPLYDNFGDPISKAEARKKLGLREDDKIALFFGFIRKYKGLDLLLEAMKELKNDPRNIKLMVAGEFYDDEKEYNELISKLGISDSLIMRTQFIPDSEVKYYLCAADVVVQPYRNATQSGVTPLAYHFEVPMVVTNVGGLPSLVPHDKVGLVCEPEPKAIAAAISEYFNKGEQYFLPALRMEKQKYSWHSLVETIETIAAETKG
ncbi:glycosyltransferase [Pseudobacter ginsenosidimutans]|uniref:Glycosyltransferase involved in cell wall biosynthesis n=1 Tax=Pseudobacter ginsenosidimutans TaxID=661488 RepID=A0A4Q7N4H9_9BACT|nr:glycosyltransferase [Pseudobacter ginsenosidimutans]QEC44444.1 glycosyltransferase [Pseudobacter ginsenosidimutans]RZS75916.1 glycosyltransferase involved in cell wall biosynthesis [Pseudobacter ginsenosidimutans]